MYADLVISNTVMIVLGLEFLFSVGVPVAALIIWKKKTDVSLSPALMGAAAFFVFVMVAEQIVHFLVLGLNPTISGFILNRPWLYALYGSLAAGLFEETARFLVFRTMMRKEISRENAVTYAIGHGGMECIMVLGMTVLSNFFIAAMFNNIGAEEFIAQYAPESTEAMIESIHAINDIDVLSAVMACVERLSAMVLQLELSVLVFAAVHLEKLWLYPLAILAHMGIDFVAGMYQTGLVSIWLVEGLVIAYVILLAIPVYRLYKSLPKENAPKLDKFGRDPRLGLI